MVILFKDSDEARLRRVVGPERLIQSIRARGLGILVLTRDGFYVIGIRVVVNEITITGCGINGVNFGDIELK